MVKEKGKLLRDTDTDRGPAIRCRKPRKKREEVTRDYDQYLFEVGEEFEDALWDLDMGEEE